MLVRDDGRRETIASKVFTTVQRGDRLIVETPGGGGYGQPKARDRSAVVDDLENGKISMDTARQIYGLDLSGAD